MKQKQIVNVHSPTLNTVIMVERTLKEANEVMSIAELKKRLPKQVMHQTLMQKTLIGFSQPKTIFLQ